MVLKENSNLICFSCGVPAYKTTKPIHGDEQINNHTAQSLTYPNGSMVSSMDLIMCKSCGQSISKKGLSVMFKRAVAEQNSEINPELSQL